MDGGRYVSDQPLDSDEDDDATNGTGLGPARGTSAGGARFGGTHGGGEEPPQAVDAGASLDGGHGHPDIGFEVESSDSGESSDTEDMEYRRRQRRLSGGRPMSRGLGGSIPGVDNLDARLSESIV